MRRTTVRICVYLLLGLATSVVAAWAMPLIPWSQKSRAQRTSVSIPEGVPKGWAIYASANSFHRRVILSWEALQTLTPPTVDELTLRAFGAPPGLRPAPGFESAGMHQVVQAGFPMRSLAGLVSYNNSRVLTAASVAGAGRSWAWRFPTGAAPSSADPEMPMFPMPLGLAIDTAFFAALWLGLIAGAGAVRREMRRRRGQCPRCAYDLRDGVESGCPECGWERDAAPSRS